MSEVTGYRVMKVEPDSEAENTLCKRLIPVCKDKYICRLGVLFDKPYNEYIFSENDCKRMRDVMRTF